MQKCQMMAQRRRELGLNRLFAIRYEEPPVGSEVSKVVKIPLTVVPIPEMAPTQTSTIKASMTAYSVTVGPSSDRMNCRIRANIFRLVTMLSPLPVDGLKGRVLIGSHSEGGPAWSG